MNIKNWLWNITIALDQIINAVAGGEAGDTVSSHTGRSGLGNVMDKFLNLFQDDHSVKSLQYTPWGTVDPHNLHEFDDALAADWDRFIQVKNSPRDIDVFLPETIEAAERAAKRLRLWSKNGGKTRWLNRFSRDVYSGNAFITGVTYE